MATLTHAESRRLYSWWWDSHISPKNSKWLKENLADIDIKVKAMIKLIEEDADSFARRAEMYYKKRPELMKLVEEFYRAYRALAERYDHATGALRQAHRTMAEAFPNQVPFALPDEPPGSCTSEMSQPIHALFDYGDLQKGLKQFSDMIGGGEEMTPSKANGRKGRKDPNLQDGGGNGSQFKLQQDLTQLTEENQNLKRQFTSASMRAHTAEAEVQTLKETISKLISENEDVVYQNQLSLERISKMESDISNSKDESRLEDKMLAVTGKLSSAEEQCHLLEKSNHFLQLELDSIKQKEKVQQEEINQHEEELKKLESLLEDAHLQFLQSETRRLSLEKVHLQSQEETRLLTMEIQTGIEKLKDIEHKRTGLEEELRQLKEENVSLNDQHLASALEIINLQDEVIFLKDSKVKLEDEVRLRVEDNKNIQQELSGLKEDRNDLEQNCHRLKRQAEMVNSTKESFDVLVKELQTENEELKELLKKHEHEELVHLENLKCLKKTTEKNVVLENSLSDANAELEGLREKIKALEEFCKPLCHEFSLHVFEKALLVSQVETISQDMDILSEENTFLDNSLCDVNIKLEGLQGKVCNLLSEKSTLVSEVEGTVQSLQNLEASYARLELKHLNLEKDKDLTLQQAIQVEESLNREKEEYETLILSIMLSSKSQLSSLENQIRFLQEESQLKEEEFKAEKHKNMDSQIEIFILQRCVHDMEEEYSILSVECQKLLEALKSAGKLISELKLKILTQDEKLTLSEKCNGKLREGIQLVLREISFSKQSWVLDGTGNDLLVQLTLHEIRGLLNSFSDIHDENQHLLVEKSVIFTFLEQFGLDAMDLTVRKNALEQEFKTRTEEFLLLQSKNLELLMMNEQSRSDMQASNQRQEVQKVEMDFLSEQLGDLQGTCNTLHSERCKLIEENLALAEMIYSLSEKKEILEEENKNILIEAATLENLYLIFRSSCAEKTSEVQLIENDLAHLRGVTNGLDEDIELLTEKLGAMEIENVCLKETAFNLRECQRLLMSLRDDFSTSTNMCKQLNSDIESGRGLLEVKDIELMQANENLLSLQNKNTELCRNIDGLLLNINCASMVRNELESKILCLSEEKEHMCKEAGIIHHENEELNLELGRLNKEVQYLRNREEHLTIELQKSVHDVKSCEIEIAALYSDLQTTTVNGSVFEEKVLELLIACESLEMNSMVQRERLHDELIQRTANLDELKGKVETAETEIRGLKEELDAFLLLVPALSDDVTTVEEHILSLAKHHASRRQERRDNKVVPLQHKENSEELGEFHDERVPSGILELHQLQTKVKMLQKLVVDTGSLLEHEIPESNGNLEDAMKDVEVVKSKNKSASYDSGTDNKLWYGDARNSTVNSEQYMKDIQLDLVLTSSQRGNDVGSNSPSMLENTGNNQDLDLWETTETDRSIQMPKARSSMSSHDTDYQEIVVVEDESHKYSSSELVAEKELSIDKLELHRKAADLPQEWNSRVIEGLSSDAQRLWALQTGMQELKRNMETSEMNNTPTSFEFDTVKAQLKEAEESILQLIDINMKLTRKAENISASSDIRPAEKSDEQNKSRRKISESARRVSEKIGSLELELHKIQYILLKLKEEHEMKREKSTDRRKVLLRDYIYGKMDRRKKRGVCRCMRPKTKDN